MNDLPLAYSGFEADLIREIERLIAGLPANTAHLRVSSVPDHPDWAEPYFEVIPCNSKAAPIKGIVIKGDLNLTIGEAAWREFIGFSRGGTVERGTTWQEDLHWIWHAVVKGGFTEHIYRSSDGKAIGWSTRLSANGKSLIIRNGRVFEKIFRRAKAEDITYESYLRPQSA